MKIIDLCCGGRMMWYQPKNPYTLFLDIRNEPEGTHKDLPLFAIKPDRIADFRDLSFLENESFDAVIFDPPHIRNLNKKSWIHLKYGSLNQYSWSEDLKKGFSEGWRILKKDCFLFFKWSSIDIPAQEVLKLFPVKPFFGDRSGKNKQTSWIFFCKI